MRLLILLLALPLASCAAPCVAAESAPTTSTSGSWVLTFEDDFLGTALNESNWTPSNYSSVVSEYDGHNALYTADRVSVGGGVLTLTTVWEPQTFNGVHYNMTSGWVDSAGKRNQTRGRFEASMRMPSSNATGTWPAWWLLPEQRCWPVSGEIDIVEYYTGEGHNQHSRPDNPPQMSSSYHYGYSCGADLYSYPADTTWWPSGNWTPNYPVIDFTADFHVFGVEINDTSIRWYVDNATNTIMTITAPPLCVSEPGFEWGKTMYMPWEPLYGILETAVNKADANLDWWLANNATTLVDWVRFWQFVPDEVAPPNKQH